MSFTVKSVRETGTVTYHCATPSYALEKLKDFQQAEYRDIMVFDADDLKIPESKLHSLVGDDRLQHLRGPHL